MSAAKHRLWTWFAALLPMLGLVALVVRAEVAVHFGATYRIPIRGYDPRDIFRGQYLRYEFDFDWQEDASCPSAGLGDGEIQAPARHLQRPEAGCCLCLTRTLPNGFNPKVRQVDCADGGITCDDWIHSSDVIPPLRYFVPENRAEDLQRALSTEHPSIEISLPRSGKPAIKELYLGDKPWRKVLVLH
jgi:uncharacterized membrane-anchored protein